VAADVTASPLACNAIYDQTPPFDLLDVYQPLPTGPMSTTLLGGNNQVLSCTADPQAQPTLCVAASGAMLTIDSVSATTLTGHYTMTFENGTSRGRSFTVLVCGTRVGCP
jgi:hypothetical protein